MHAEHPDITKAIDRLVDQLMRSHKLATGRHSRGVFVRADPDKLVEAECIFTAVAVAVTPLVLMIERLRAEVNELKNVG